VKKILVVIATLLIIGLAIVFVLYISKVAPSNTSVIKKYSYPIEIKEIVNRIQKFCNEDSCLNARITDTTGTTNTGYSYYLNIEIRRSGRDLLYSIACENIYSSKVPETTIELVLAYDKINNIGGYNSRAPGVKDLVDYFDTNFIAPFEKYQ
jgi:hypothetical protein